MPQPTWLLDHTSNTFSQTGEDGVIAQCLQLLPDRDHWCVEFGAWDGRQYSNTCNLIENGNYSAVLIEASKKKYQELQQFCNGRPNIHAVNRFVGFTEQDSLDTILREYPIPTNFDFLSIDIDGNDYHTWQATTKYSPKIVCIEFNPTFPTEASFVQPADPNSNIGSSLGALVDLGKKKGYELVCVLHFNAIFVKENYFPLFGIDNNNPALLRQHLEHISYMGVGYDGTIVLVGNNTLPWHELPIVKDRFQYLPRFLRTFPPNYNPLQRLAFAMFEFCTDPRRSIRRLARALKSR